MDFLSRDFLGELSTCFIFRGLLIPIVTIITGSLSFTSSRRNICFHSVCFYQLTSYMHNTALVLQNQVGLKAKSLID